MAPALIRKALFAIGIASLAMPAAAQFTSDGYEFLKAVRDGEAQKVTDTLNEPGSTVINHRDRTTGETALHIVTKQREPIWIRFLLQKGANPNIADRDGVTPLMIASSFGYFEEVKELLKGGARVDVSNDAGETPLISAVHRRDTEMMKLLLEHGANPDKADNSGRNARDYVAVMNSNNLMIEVFAEHDKKAEEARQAPKTYGPEIR